MSYKTKQEWKLLIAEFEKSGLTQADFCRQYSLNAKSQNKDSGAADKAENLGG
jgi:hypothetical protein